MVPLYDAIRKGRHLLRTVPYILVGLSIIGLGLWIYAFQGWTQYLIPCAFLGGALLFIPIKWIWWSYWVVKWKIWAYQKVIDIHLLEQRAITNRLIWPQNSFWTKTEFRFGKQKNQLAKLEKRLKKPRKYELIIDTKIPDTYTIYYTSRGLYIGLIIIILASCLFMFLGNNSYWIFLISLPLSALGFWEYYKFAFGKKVWMRINEFQIYLTDPLSNKTTPKAYSWDKIKFFKIEHRGYGSERNTFLHIKFKGRGPHKFLDLNLDRAATSCEWLEYLMDVYYSRFWANQTSLGQKTKR